MTTTFWKVYKVADGSEHALYTQKPVAEQVTRGLNSLGLGYAVEEVEREVVQAEEVRNSRGEVVRFNG